MALPNLVDGMRPTRRRTPNIRPHARTMLRVQHGGWGPSSKWVSRILGGTLIILAGAVYVLLFWSPQFRVEEPVVSGTSRLNPAAIIEVIRPLLSGTRWGIAPANALLATQSSQLKKTITDTFSSVSDVQIRKELPNVLKIEIIEREPLAIWSAAGQFFFIDDRGIAFEEIVRSDSRDVSLPVIVDERNRATVEGDRVLTEATLTFVRETFNGITRQTGVGINFFVAPSRLAPDLTLLTSDGWKVMFNTEQPASAQIATLAEILDTQVSDRGALQYIDLRIPGRVFVM